MASGPDTAPKKRVAFEDEDDDATAPAGKLSKTMDRFDPAVREVLNEINANQDEMEEMNEKAAVEILDVEKKYNILRKPFFDKRQSIIEKISGFWFKTLVTHPHVAAIVSDEQRQCLEYLRKLEVIESEDVRSGYAIKFTFAKNPFFDNEFLIKEFRFETSSSVGTEILWKPNMDLTETRVQKKKRIRHDTPQSFFDWFNFDKNPFDDAIADAIKDDIWANPLQYFATGRDAEGLEAIEEDEESYWNEEEQEAHEILDKHGKKEAER